MGRGFQGAMLRGLGARDHVATVVGTAPVAPNCVRITMSAPTLFEDLLHTPAEWLRFWFPDPDGGATEHQRAYTIVTTNEDVGEFSIDVVIHEPAGPACQWAASAQPGMTIPVVAFGSARFEVPEDLPAGFLLIGDSASIPAINSIMSALPADVDVEVYLERHSPDDELIPLTDHARRQLHWVDRIDETSLAAAIESRDWSNWYGWATSESGSLKHLRKRLKDEFGFPKAEIHAAAYWTFGRAMGSRRGDTEAPKPATPKYAATQPETLPSTAAQPAPIAEPAAPQGRWRSQGAGELLKPVKKQMIAGGALQAVISLVELAPFVVLVELTRQLLAGADETRLRQTGFIFVVLLVLGATLGMALTLWLHVVDLRFSASIRRRLLDKLSRVPLGWFTQRGSGPVKKLIQDDTISLHYLITHSIPDAVAAVVGPVAVLVYLFVIEWRMALILLIPILIYLLTMMAMMYQSGPKIIEASRWANRMSGESTAYLEGQPVIRIFGGAAASSFKRRLDDYLRFLNDWQRPFIGRKTFMDLVTRPTTFLWLIATTGTLFVVSGTMQPVTLLPFLVLGTTFGARLLGIAYGLGSIRGGLEAARHIANALDETELDVVDAPAAADGTSSVSFEGVTFGYRPSIPVIHDVTVTLRPGTVTALVGPSGSGKSTLASLLARFHDVDGGAIRIDGNDIRALTPDELYAKVGFVFQDVQLVAGTVRENIALALPEATDTDIESAARDAQIHDRILRLPHGYDTMLDTNTQLSGGEKQRLTIARALLADTPILILDEATAFADPESEYLVQQALAKLIDNRTVLVIAHRLHTIADADQIVVLDHGRIVETGTHTDLLAHNGRYRRLWEGHRHEPSSALAGGNV
ncbi:ABC transporter ATP-binding protein/permease [Mycobacteroides immunogenum]|uniref:Mycobactin import ATP-binding/permease protein IrtA n=1 Tax=Mycobacteroides immunogenum TaxID=83262 RepID=A0A7V8RUX0_9MYCO|nr:ABC transporter ATP-binding protein/permease [Mycobacteroides immunogenum]AMT70911.1 iron ABC transporter permease [Mycobacteroides immunogenum]ANO04019.1 iron ABC transporter permease [Mycobacteroides immunogenum]KIU39498.1 iron ABC transporter permease [Mycobacteroides immunogenum]KPG03967.1 iron ABC transporter permease [Mycobacteroides immunogenum]KPG04454.1 iron ABC transporter permease [Mycobacteroides immunogenum]